MKSWFAGLMLTSAIAPAEARIVLDPGSEPEREQTVLALSEQASGRKAAALNAAQEQGWPVRGVMADGAVYELMALADDGRPMYRVTRNANAALSTAADRVRDADPFDVAGSGVIVGVWDEGNVRKSHQEFGSPSRVTLKNAGALDSNHATHVGGTIAAAGTVAAARGMAPSAQVHSYDWNDDLAEMAAAAALDAGQTAAVNISNHSYGWLTGWEYGNWSGASGWHWFGVSVGEREDREFGRYNSESRDWDDLCHAAPWFLPFKAAGNDRDDGMPSGGTYYYWAWGMWVGDAYDPETAPHADGHKDGGYNTIGHAGVSKNVMTVGSVSDAVMGGQRDTGAASASAFSGWGPTDDGRVKPDIVANGASLYSSLAGSDTQYGSMSGTSMATPNAVGSAALLADYHRSRFEGMNMRAATLKGLIIHTADDLGNPGPDYQYGWGLMNTEAAAEHIRRHAGAPDASGMVEAVLENGAVITCEITWNGTDPIRVTLSWTDPPGEEQPGLNAGESNLVNDLDVRILGPDATVYRPYVLDPANPSLAATTGINTRDNVEQIRIPASVLAEGAAGPFTVEITCGGTLSGGAQAFSLLIGGQVQETQEPPPEDPPEPKNTMFKFR